MRTIEIKAYTFDELSDDAKEKARNWWLYSGLDYDWYESTYEDAKRIGLKITGFNLDRNRHATGEFLLSANEVAANIFKEHGETCETYKTAESFMEDWSPIFNMYMDETCVNYESRECEDDLQDLEDDFLESLLEDYSIMLQNEYEYMCSDKYIDECITINEYEFDKNGKIIRNQV